MKRLSPILLTGLLACNRYDYFNIAGYEQSSFSNDADILFVIDNSGSMKDEAVALGTNLNSFIDLLSSEDGATESTENLNDAVNSFVTYVNERGRFINYQLGITTTTVAVDDSGGATPEIDPGEAGLLLGDPTLIGKYDVDVAGKFKKNILCEATYWDPTLLTEDSEITAADLEEMCGPGWSGNSGSGNEEPLEAALLALCRSVENPPEACYDPKSSFDDSQKLSNEGLIRDNSTVVIVIVGDEGDNSRRLRQGEKDPEVYLEAFEEFELRLRFVVIGPNYIVNEGGTQGSFACNSGGAETWQVERLRTLADESSGMYRPLEEECLDDCPEAEEGAPPITCRLANFSQHLEDLGSLLNSLEPVYQLDSIPDVSTIKVYVNDQLQDESEILNATEYAEVPDVNPPEYGEGWSYDSAQNAVVFWGAAIPDYNSDIRIYYRPLSGTPRELPFTY